MEFSPAALNSGSCQCTYQPFILQYVRADCHRYLPIGIGLFQAQNQQLLLVSRDQSRILYTDHYKPLYQGYGRGIGGPKYWFWRVKLWWQGTSTQGKYEGFVLIGMVVQVCLWSDIVPRSSFVSADTLIQVPCLTNHLLHLT